MSEFVGAFAASHAPLVARIWDKFEAPTREWLDTVYRELGRRIQAARPDTLIVVAPDHWVNFFINNLPNLCIGVGEVHGQPPEPFLANFPHKQIVGDPSLAQHLLKTALENDFEPSVSYDMKLDHGFCIPLMRAMFERLPKIVPIVLNSLEPPMPSLNRCLAFGRVLRQAIESHPGKGRVAILATGGLSHSIGEPTMGLIDEEVDWATIHAFEKGAVKPLVSYLDANMDRAGNGTHEVRNWLVCHGAAEAKGFELIDYKAVPEVYVGCGFASWNLAA